MATVASFEELVVWQDARQLVKVVYAETQRRPWARDYRFCSQIQSAATSTMSNIAEGFERGTKQEFIHFLNIAKGSNGELRLLLHVALDQTYLGEDRFKELQESALALSRRLACFIKYLEGFQGKSRLRKAEAKSNV